MHVTTVRLTVVRSWPMMELSVSGADPGAHIGGGHMASAERERIMGVWGLCPQRSPGAEQGAKPPEAERFLVLSNV